MKEKLFVLLSIFSVLYLQGYLESKFSFFIGKSIISRVIIVTFLILIYYFSIEKNIFRKFKFIRQSFFERLSYSLSVQSLLVFLKLITVLGIFIIIKILTNELPLENDVSIIEKVDMKVLLIIGIIGPIYEEIIYRALITNSLLKITDNKFKVLIYGTLIFFFSHLQMDVFLLINSFGLTLVYILKKDIYINILIHCFNNTFIYCYNKLPEYIGGIIMIIYLFIIIYFTYYFFRKKVYKDIKKA